MALSTDEYIQLGSNIISFAGKLDDKNNIQCMWDSFMKMSSKLFPLKECIPVTVPFIYYEDIKTMDKIIILISLITECCSGNFYRKICYLTRFPIFMNDINREKLSLFTLLHDMDRTGFNFTQCDIYDFHKLLNNNYIELPKAIVIISDSYKELNEKDELQKLSEEIKIIYGQTNIPYTIFWGINDEITQVIQSSHMFYIGGIMENIMKDKRLIDINHILSSK